MNIWRESAIVKEFVFSKRLARIAAELMGTTGVRMYHDQALYKEGKGGFTPWHADQYYWPLASDALGHGVDPAPEDARWRWARSRSRPRATSSTVGRDMEISDKSQQQIEKQLLAKGLGQFEEPFELGEMSFHAGWTFHRAGRNLTDKPREVMTVIYMDEDMRLAAPRNENQQPTGTVGAPARRSGS
jgi:hypothetical protein